MLLGRAAMEKLRRSSVAVFGMGAVGSFAAEGLARSGVGRLFVVDFDKVSLSNINRQLLALYSTIGRSKVELARDRILDINPDAEVAAWPLFVDAGSAAMLMKEPFDAVIDAIDSMGPKLELLSAAVSAGRPVVSSMGAARKTEIPMIRVGDISETDVCPVARLIRKRLRKRGIASGVRCVYSIEQPSGCAASDPDAAPPPDEETLRRGRKRTPLPSLSCLTAAFGMTAAREAIRLVCGR